jgi:cytochrome oxidase Cu insertion factor (SCO1/SenC/PrrC family)
MDERPMPGKQRTLLIALWATTGIAVVCMGALPWVLNHRANVAPPHAMETSETSSLPILFDAPPFSLTDENGKPFDSSQLAHQVWIADFVFTHCAGICPMMTQNLARFQKLTPGSSVQMVSFSVDPEHDTPAVLKAYGAEVKADESRWHFLTGTRAQTWEISKGMKLAVGPDTGDQVMHSSHFLLVDGDGKVRGIYDADDANFMKKLIDDSASLSSPAH